MAKNAHPKEQNSHTIPKNINASPQEQFLHGCGTGGWSIGEYELIEESSGGGSLLSDD
jgi:hypothetical protein